VRVVKGLSRFTVRVWRDKLSSSLDRRSRWWVSLPLSVRIVPSIILPVGMVNMKILAVSQM
jgi:hypothetical protein